MKTILKRSIFLTLLLLVIVATYIYILLDLPFEETWLTFYDLQFANVPLGLWILTTIFLLSWSLSAWSVFLSKSKEKAIVQSIDRLVATTETTNTPKANVSRIDQALREVSNMIATQRKSLQRITNERAETQDQMIQERIVEERQRLARELHDSVSQQLFAASMLLSAITESAEESSHQKSLIQVERMVQQAQLEMRALLLHLRPAPLHNKSLAEGLQDLLVELKEKVMFAIHYRLEEVILPKGAEDHLFRIAQETLSNALRHAKATEVDVLFIERNGLAILRVQDNGVGFKENEEKSGSYGLKNVQERAIEMGATYKIVSVPSQGTIVEVQLPVEKGTHSND